MARGDTIGAGAVGKNGVKNAPFALAALRARAGARARVKIATRPLARMEEHERSMPEADSLTHRNTSCCHSEFGA